MIKLKLFLVMYNMSGAVVGSLGPVAQPISKCQEEVAKSTMLSVTVPKSQRLSFACEYRERRPVVTGPTLVATP